MANDEMILICGTRQITNPTDEHIRTELDHLIMENENSFAILGSSGPTYIQIAGDKTSGFNLEYQEGSTDSHFNATDSTISLDQVVEAFIAYRDNDSSWKNKFTFEKYPL